MRRRISRAQQTKNWCVGFSFPPPAYAGIHPTLYLFGFRADALNSHSPPYLPERLWAFPVVAFGAPKPSGGLRGLWGAFGGLWCPRFRGALPGFGAPLRPLEASRGPLRAPPGWPPSTTPCLANPKFQHFPGHLLETAGQWAPRATPRKPPQDQGRWV